MHRHRFADQTLASGWRVALLIIAILAAVVTPTPDPVNMAIVMLPMIVLYVLSIGAAKIAQRQYEASRSPGQDHSAS